MKLTTPLAALCAVALFAATPMIAAAQNIGVVNIQKVFNDLREVKDIKTQFSAKAEQLQSQKAAAESRVKGLTESRAQFKPGSTEYDNTNKEIVKLVTESQVQLQIAQAELTQQQKVQTKQVFDKIDAAVAEVAKAKNLAVVVSQLAPELSQEMMERANPEQLNQALFSRSVLYAAPNVDITADVVTKLDAGYAAPSGTPTPAP